MTKEIELFLDKVRTQLESNQATEHSYRPALKALLNSLDESIEAINEPKQSEHGAPDFIVIGKKNKDLKLGYGEAKIPGENLDKIEKSEQMDRYKGYANLFLTDCLDWRFFRNGEKIFELQIGELNHDKTEISKVYTDRYTSLANEIANFLGQPPENIRSGRRLAEIMGGKARRIRDNILLREQKNPEIENIYKMMTKLLVHDLSYEKFADMYSQTLIYGLFVARYMDRTEKDFSRQEARDLVPKSNPFLRQFFDHVAGVSFDASLGYIVDELCDVFAISDIHTIVHKHLKVIGEEQNDKDPIIHFYEDFLREYDPQLKKQMGAYYTPVPVVRYIIRQVDRILKEDFGITNGIASEETIKRTVSTQGHTRGQYGKKLYTTKEIIEPLVQVLDPAVGTATFLNETIKYIYNNNFGDQKGRWPSYVNDNLIKRLFGFELMMAPYTIAHMKLGMTLSELGATQLKNRLGVYLTNTLEEGNPIQPDLLSYGGLVAAVTEESDAAAEIKSNAPVMIVMGNPPYSVSSSNKSQFATELVAPYKKDLNERNIQPLSDDYIKFIAFSEMMIAKNGTGILAMITNNSYLDGIIHREMRRHLAETFDIIYIVDLHGNSKKKETSPDGSLDQNVFDIMQGVAIIVAVKTTGSTDLATIQHVDIFGKRKDKFDILNMSQINWEELKLNSPNYFFVKKDSSLDKEYLEGISLKELFKISGSGIKFRKDNLLISNNFSKNDAKKMVSDMQVLDVSSILSKYKINETSDWTVNDQRQNFLDPEENMFIQVEYRPFDFRWTYFPYSKINKIIPRGDSRLSLMKNIISRENIILNTSRTIPSNLPFNRIFVSKNAVDIHTIGDQNYAFPLYIYDIGNNRQTNFNESELVKLTSKLKGDYKPEHIIDYIYAILYSQSYRLKYNEQLKIDFPRVPIPTQSDFDRLVPLGTRLRELHLMDTDLTIGTSYPEVHDNGVEKVERVGDNVFINNKQYFGGVSDSAWNFYIGGYQPAQKWLKDRRGQVLNSNDIIHYQKIITVLNATDMIMKEIDSRGKIYPPLEL